jgi:hypothetical protein
MSTVLPGYGEARVATIRRGLIDVAAGTARPRVPVPEPGNKDKPRTDKRQNATTNSRPRSHHPAASWHSLVPVDAPGHEQMTGINRERDAGHSLGCR